MSVEIAAIPNELMSAWVKSLAALEQRGVVVERRLRREEARVRTDRRRGLQRQRHEPRDRDQRVQHHDEDPDRPRAVLCRVGVWHITSPRLLRRGRAEPLDEQTAITITHEEDQHRDRRAQAEVEPRDQLVVAEDRHRLGAVGAARLDEHRVEHAEGVERAEQHRHQDRRLHQRQRDPPEALPRAGAVDLRGLVQLVGHQRQARQAAAAP